jgi:hypothetical protein
MHPCIKGQVPGPSSHLSPVWRRPNLPRLTTVISRVLPSQGRGREFESRRVRHFIKDLAGPSQLDGADGNHMATVRAKVGPFSRSFRIGEPAMA